MHRTVVDNIDEIVKAVYQQGMSDGQRRVVETAANVKVNTPNVGNVQPGNNVEEQLRQIIGESDSMMRFRF
jgi:flagellar basal body P-ring protein FlgI